MNGGRWNVKAIISPLMWTGLALTSVVANAQTAHPRVIAGFDHIAPQQVGKVLAAFCKENGCKADGNTWNLTVDNTTPVSIGSKCHPAGLNYDYYVQAWGSADKAFMNSARMQQLKAMLEAKGATVTLMNCSFEWSHGNYVCANSKPLP